MQSINTISQKPFHDIKHLLNSDPEQLFNNTLKIKTHYNPHKLLDHTNLQNHLESNLPLTRKNLQNFVDSMNKLQYVYNDIIINGSHQQQYLNKFHSHIEKRVASIFQAADDHLLMKQNSPDLEIPSDFDFNQLRQLIRENLISISNQLHQDLISRSTSSTYEINILSKCHEIERLYDCLKYDHSWCFILSKTCFNSSTILDDAVNNRTNEPTDVKTFLERYILIDIDGIKSEIEYKGGLNTQILHQKETSIHKLHQILTHKDVQKIKSHDIAYIARSILSKDRRKVYRDIDHHIQQILQQTYPQLYNQQKTGNENFDNQKRQYMEQFHNLEQKYHEVITNQFFVEIQNGSINEDNIHQLTRNQQLLDDINKYQNEVTSLQINIVHLIQDIDRFKDDFYSNTEHNLGEAIELVIYNLQKDKENSRNPYDDRIKNLINQLFDQLKKLLSQNPVDNKQQSINDQLEKQVKNTDNPFLKRVLQENVQNSIMRNKEHNYIQDKIKMHNEALDHSINRLQNDPFHPKLYNESNQNRPYQVNNSKAYDLTHNDREHSPIQEPVQKYVSSMGKYTNKIIEDMEKLREERQQQIVGNNPNRQSIVDKLIKPTNSNDLEMLQKREQERQEKLQQQKEELQRRKQEEENKREQARIQKQQEEQMRKEQQQLQKIKEDEARRELLKKKEEDDKKREEQRLQRQKEDEKKNQEEKLKKQKDDEAKREQLRVAQLQKEEDDKKKAEIKKKQQLEEDMKKEEQRKIKLKEDEQRKEKEQLLKKKEDDQKKELEKKRMDDDRKREEQKKKDDELKKQQKLKEDDDRKKHEDQLKIQKQKEEEQRKQKQKEDEDRKNEEKKKKEDELKIQKQKDEEAKKQKQKEDEDKRRKDEEDKKRKDEEQKKKLADEEKKRQEDLKKKEEQRKKEEDEKKAREEAEKRKIEEMKKIADEKRKKDEEEKRKKDEEEKRKKDEEDKRKREETEKKQLEEKRRKEEEQHKIMLLTQQKEEEDKKKTLKQPPQQQPPKQSQYDYALDFEDIEESNDKVSLPGPSRNNKKFTENSIGGSIQEDINYDDDFENDSSLKKNIQQKSSNLKPLVKNNSISEFGSEDIDLPGLDHNNQGGESDEIETKETVTIQNLNQTNLFLKKTKYLTNFKNNLSQFNTMDSLTTLMEEFIQQQQAFFLNFEDSQILLQIFEKAAGGEDISEHSQQFLVSILQQMSELLQQDLEDFNPALRFYFPFDESFNQFLFYLMEINPTTKTIAFYFEDEPNEQALGEEFDFFLQVVAEIFQTTDYQIESIVLDNTAKQALSGLEGEYFRYMATVFNVQYELQLVQPSVTINKDTLDRIAYLLDILPQFYQKLTEEQIDNTTAHYAKLLSSLKNDKSVIIEKKSYQFAQTLTQQLPKNIEAIKQSFVKDNQKKQGIYLININLGEQQLNFYIHLSKTGGLNFIKIFTLQNYEQQGEQILNFMLKPGDQQFSQKIFIDFARHYGLYQYGDITLGLFAYLCIKKEYTSENAMALIGYSMIPYHICLIE